MYICLYYHGLMEHPFPWRTHGRWTVHAQLSQLSSSIKSIERFRHCWALCSKPAGVRPRSKRGYAEIRSTGEIGFHVERTFSDLMNTSGRIPDRRNEDGFLIEGIETIQANEKNATILIIMGHVYGDTTWYVYGDTWYVYGNMGYVYGDTWYVYGDTWYVYGNMGYVYGDTWYVYGDTWYVYNIIY